MLAGVNEFAMAINDFLWNWPLIILFFVTACVITAALHFVQIRYFFRAWSLLVTPGSVKEGKRVI